MTALGTQTLMDLIEAAPELPEEPISRFTPSAYQQAIFDHADHGEGDAFVGAVAGSGKTTTLVQLANRLSPREQQSAAFVAFNKHIVKELADRLPSGFTVRTIHSLGYSALRKHFKWEGDPVDEKKYRTLAKEFTQDFLTEHPEADFSADEMADALLRACSLSRLTLTDPQDPFPTAGEDCYWPLWELCDRFGIDVLDEGAMAQGVTHMLEQGRKLADQKIDIDDMVWLAASTPGLRPWQYDTLYVDECQDLNAAQREFVLRLRRGRAYWVGDERQAIYGFAGADVQSVRTIAEKTGAVRLPLSICYRCPQSHVRLAQQIVPEIEWADNAREGVVADVMRAKVGQALREASNPLVLCRTTQPLIELCFELIRQGIPATVKGRDIGKQLTVLIENVAKLKSFQFEDFDKYLEDWCMKRIKLLTRKEQTAQIQSLEDKWQTVALIHEKAVGEGVQTVEELAEYTEDLFRDTPQVGAPVLSTVHKAKGLEASDVFILREDMMPHPMAKRMHEVEQEMNLRYVALTRSKDRLFFVRECL